MHRPMDLKAKRGNNLNSTCIGEVFVSPTFNFGCSLINKASTISGSELGEDKKWPQDTLKEGALSEIPRCCTNHSWIDCPVRLYKFFFCPEYLLNPKRAWWMTLKDQKIRGKENEQIIFKVDVAAEKMLACWVLREDTMINMLLQGPGEKLYS